MSHIHWDKSFWLLTAGGFFEILLKKFELYILLKNNNVWYLCGKCMATTFLKKVKLIKPCENLNNER